MSGIEKIVEGFKNDRDKYVALYAEPKGDGCRNILATMVLFATGVGGVSIGLAYLASLSK